MPSTETATTKEKILDAAEKLFAEHGFAATSLRNITAEADVNLAAVNYHFGSKEALIQAVFERRLGPLNLKRLELLGEIESSAGDGPLPLEPIVKALVGPPLRMYRDPGQGGPVVMRLYGHTYSEPSEQISQMFYDQFKEVGERFGAALGRALPDLPVVEVFWRLMFVVGAMAQAMTAPDKLPQNYKEVLKPSDPQDLVDRLVPFLVAGLRAPAPALKKRGTA